MSKPLYVVLSNYKNDHIGWLVIYFGLYTLFILRYGRKHCYLLFILDLLFMEFGYGGKMATRIFLKNGSIILTQSPIKEVVKQYEKNIIINVEGRFIPSFNTPSETIFAIPFEEIGLFQEDIKG